MKHLIEQTLRTTEIYKGKIIDLQLDEVELPNGKTSQRELVKHPGAVAVIPLTSEGRLVLVRQYRKALDKIIVEIPAGKLEENEERISCAKRELEEETGYAAKELRFVASFYTSPGFANEIIHLYLAEQLTNGEANTDEDEFLDVVEVTLDEAEQMVKEQSIHDAKTMYAVQYLRMRELVGE